MILYFGQMRLLLSFFLVFSLFGCKITAPASSAEKERISIEIIFSTDEAIKRVPYQLTELELKLSNAINGIERGYYATILVNSDKIDSIMDKIGNEDGVARVSVLNQ